MDLDPELLLKSVIFVAFAAVMSGIYIFFDNRHRAKHGGRVMGWHEKNAIHARKKFLEAQDRRNEAIRDTRTLLEYIKDDLSEEERDVIEAIRKRSEKWT